MVFREDGHAEVLEGEIKASAHCHHHETQRFVEVAEDLGKGEKRGQDGTRWDKMGEGGQVTWMSGE